MLLLTGVTDQVGRTLLRRLTAAGTPVRCLESGPTRPADLPSGDRGDPRRVAAP